MKRNRRLFNKPPKVVKTPVIGDTYMINKKGWLKVIYLAPRGDDYIMEDFATPYVWSYIVGQGEVYVLDTCYTRLNPQQ